MFLQLNISRASTATVPRKVKKYVPSDHLLTDFWLQLPALFIQCCEQFFIHFFSCFFLGLTFLVEEEWIISNKLWLRSKHKMHCSSWWHSFGWVVSDVCSGSYCSKENKCRYLLWRNRWMKTVRFYVTESGIMIFLPMWTFNYVGRQCWEHSQWPIIIWLIMLFHLHMYLLHIVNF